MAEVYIKNPLLKKSKKYAFDAAKFALLTVLMVGIIAVTVLALLKIIAIDDITVSTYDFLADEE